MERVEVTEPIKLRELTPEEEERLAADRKFLDEELLRLDAELQALDKCYIPMNDVFVFPRKARRRFRDNRIK